MKKWILFAAVLIHLLFLASLFVDLIDPLFYDTHRGKDKHIASDFFAMYTTGWMLLNKGLIYTEPEPGEMPVPYHSGVVRYLPIFTVVFCLPINLFSPWTAYWVYIALLEALLLINIFLSRVLAGRGPPSRKFFVTIMWLVYTPYFCELYLGQLTFLCATLVFWMLCLRGRRPLTEGLIWNAAIAVKMIPILFVPVFLKQKRFITLILTFLLIVLTSWYLIASCSESETEEVRADRLIPYAGEGVSWLFSKAGLEDAIPRIKVKEDLLMVYSKLFQGVAVTDYAGSPGFLPMVYQLLSFVLPEGADEKGAQKSSALSLTKLFAVLILLLMLYTTFFGRGDFNIKIMLWMSGFFLAEFTTWEHHYVLLLPVMVLMYLRTNNGFVLVIYFLLALPTPFIFYQSAAIESWLYFASKGLPALALFLMVLKENFRESADSKRASPFLAF